MKVFISSTSEDLREHRQIAAAVVRDAQCAAVVMEHFPADPRPILQLCRAKIAECDLVLLIMAHRRGWVPGPTKGGDTDSSITALEMAAADELKRPVLAFLADDDWPGRLWDDDSTARKWVKGFRGDLNRMAKLFAWEDEPKLPLFRALLSQELANYRSPGGPPRAVSIPLPTTVTLRQPDNPSFPNEPYPLLAPYEHPATFAGRDAEVEQLAGLVALSPFVLCVHAPSGAGKSSLLLAGLAPRLRDEGYAVSVDRAPGDPQLSQRLLRDLIEPSSVVTLVDDDDELPRRFADWVAEVHRLSRKRVVFVLDQIDDVLRWRGRRDDALARLGILMAATAQRLPGVQGFACKWVLCYRHEFHGEVRAWLEDVLVQARTMDRTGLKALPYDLSDTQRSHDWALPVMGKPAPDALGMWASVQAFRRAIEQPLQLMEAGGPRYPYVFAPGAAERLATAFAGARHRQPDAPLVPELQVVLAHLLARARQSSGAVATRVAELITVEVPSAEELEALIGRALTDHLGRALAKAFPQERDSAGGRTARTRALIALRHLADEGHRGEGVPQGDLVAMIGSEGTQVLARLSAADTRLVVVAEEACTLSHDKLAEVVLEVVDNEARRGNLLLDQPLLDLRRTVAQKAALYRSDSKDKSALLVTHAQRVLVEKNRDALLVSDDHRRWWQAQEQLRARDIRQFVLRGAAILVIIVSISSFAYRSYQQATTAQEALESNRLRSQLVEIVSQNRPNFVQLATLVAQETSGWNRVELNDDFVDSINPELFAAAPWLPPSVDATRILDVVERSHPLFVRSR